ncbi:TetR/AcrR family transcriptional regulator [Microbacterium sp.]|uniref:TetR/AcrR family transcriptional regulator n=1 Tax=Microbacterium sp. TaxID=51671 RepID=UPI001AC21B9D|nr:TetR/AcrR family transcriptional regulator [Microbacterium sp.]MBN9156521.1 TetR/AcrR family transcriptional regulator [Microbacterium sp.]
MGNREDLLAGARRVIVERGVANATARDIAQAAGVSLAAIGYHFGSKDQLVTEALLDTLGTGIGDGMEAAIVEAKDLPRLAGFAALWNRMPDVFAANRETLLASMENAVRMMRDPAALTRMQAAVEEGYRGVAEGLVAAYPDLTPEQALALGQLEFVLSQGLGILWLLSPEGRIPDGDTLASAVTLLQDGTPAD